jgi:hypothetical protein
MLNQKYTIVQAAKKLQQFVNKHFDSYDEAWHSAN